MLCCFREVNVPSVWNLCRFGMTRPEPRPRAFIGGQETLAWMVKTI